QYECSSGRCIHNPKPASFEKLVGSTRFLPEHSDMPQCHLLAPGNNSRSDGSGYASTRYCDLLNTMSLSELLGPNYKRCGYILLWDVRHNGRLLPHVTHAPSHKQSSGLLVLQLCRRTNRLCYHKARR